jgi:hypothetical protein
MMQSSSSIRSICDVIGPAWCGGTKNYIGGNCTVSLMLMALGGLFRSRTGRVDDGHDLSGGLRCRCAEHARTAVADGRDARRVPRAC